VDMHLPTPVWTCASVDTCASGIASVDRRQCDASVDMHLPAGRFPPVSTRKRAKCLFEIDLTSLFREAIAARRRRGACPCVTKLGKGGRDVGSRAETFRRDPAGANPARQSVAGRRKRVLRGAWVTVAAKRRQRVQRPCDRAPKDLSWEPSTWTDTGAAPTRRKWPGEVGPAGV
jgi:hypothetical protein